MGSCKSRVASEMSCPGHFFGPTLPGWQSQQLATDGSLVSVQVPCGTQNYKCSLIHLLVHLFKKNGLSVYWVSSAVIILKAAADEVSVSMRLIDWTGRQC